MPDGRPPVSATEYVGDGGIDPGAINGGYLKAGIAHPSGSVLAVSSDLAICRTADPLAAHSRRKLEPLTDRGRRMAGPDADWEGERA
jgi:hypothetical protein